MRALAAHQYSPGSKSRRRRQNYVGLVCCWFSPLLREVFFFFGYYRFPLSSKPTYPTSNSTSNQVGEKPQCGCAKSLFIYLFYLMLNSITCARQKKRLSLTLRRPVKTPVGFRDTIELNPRAAIFPYHPILTAKITQVSQI